jgi:hypothetical protein
MGDCVKCRNYWRHSSDLTGTVWPAFCLAHPTKRDFVNGIANYRKCEEVNGEGTCEKWEAKPPHSSGWRSLWTGKRKEQGDG